MKYVLLNFFLKNILYIIIIQFSYILKFIIIREIIAEFNLKLKKKQL